MRVSLRLRSMEMEPTVDTITKYPRLFRHKLGTVVIPEELRARLTGALRGYSRPSLVQNAKVLAEILRRRVRSRPSDASAGVIKPRVTLRYDRDETLTYVAHRVPGIFATAFRVFREASFKLPTFMPESMLDYGSGPGTALMAALVVWPDVTAGVAIEPSQEMQKVSERLMQDSKGIVVERRRHLIDGVEKQQDLVMASYSLGEIQDPVERKDVVKQLWSLVDDDGGVLVLIEPGTPIGFKTINDARTLLLDRGANLIAPCPHAKTCPMPNTSWCHFKQRIRKTPLQMQTKLNKVQNFSDETYSYVVAAKAPFADTQLTVEGTARHRVLRQPQKKGGHVVLQTCSEAGVYDQIVVAKSHGPEVYRSARKAFAGDEIFIGGREPSKKERREKVREFEDDEDDEDDFMPKPKKDSASSKLVVKKKKMEQARAMKEDLPREKRAPQKEPPRPAQREPPVREPQRAPRREPEREPERRTRREPVREPERDVPAVKTDKPKRKASVADKIRMAVEAETQKKSSRPKTSAEVKPMRRTSAPRRKD